MQRFRLWTTLPAALLFALSIGACGSQSDDDNEGLRILNEGGIEDIAFISRAKRLDIGDVFQYTSYSVDPKTANILRMRTFGGGEVESITPFGEGEWPVADIMAMDVSFDGQEIVFSARLEGDQYYSLYRIKIDGTNPEEPGQKGPAQIHSGPYHAVYPLYLPNDKVFFMTNETLAPEVNQFNDEYNRGDTAQSATIDKDGGGLVFGPRNLSHRVFPTLANIEGRGQILHTNWDHLANVNEGNLMVMNPDMTGAAEFFGKEGSGVSNSYLKPRQVNENQFLAIATDREDTFQAGALILINKGENEAGASADILTPDVPRGKEPSYDKVGRYYDAYPVVDGGQNLTHILTSWANGPVQTEVAGGGMMEEGAADYGEGAGPPDFGIYVLDHKTGSRLPIYNDGEMWDVMPMAIGRERAVPTSPAGITADSAPDGTSLIGALNVAENSLNNPDTPIYRVRVAEGFSTEEGVPGDFGLTEADGAILLGEAPVKADGSFAAFVPEDRPIHLQTLDQYGMSIVNEDRWFSSAAGEQRFCGGCHEERGATQITDPGISQAVGEGPEDMGLAYAARTGPNAGFADMTNKLIFPDDAQFAGADRLLGLPWDTAVQPMFEDAGCVDCHNGTAGPANPCVTIQDTMVEDPGATATDWCFDLRGEVIEWEYMDMMGSYSRSHISLLLVAGMMAEEGVELMYDPNQPYQEYMVPESARDSIIVKYAQPEQVYPGHDPNNKAFLQDVKYNGQAYEAEHPNSSTPGYAGQRPLTEAEKYILIMVADLGGQYYSLENAPGTEY